MDISKQLTALEVDKGKVLSLHNRNNSLEKDLDKQGSESLNLFLQNCSNKRRIYKERHLGNLKSAMTGSAVAMSALVAGAAGVGASGMLAISSPIMIATICAGVIALLIFISTANAYRRSSNERVVDSDVSSFPESSSLLGTTTLDTTTAVQEAFAPRQWNK